MDDKRDHDSKSKDAASVTSTHSINNGLPNEEELVPTLLKGSIDPVYEGKAQVLNGAIQDIGMGRYQWQLFVVVGGLYIFGIQELALLLNQLFPLIGHTNPSSRIWLGE